MTSMSDQAYCYIRERIINQEFSPGEPLDLKGLAKLLEMGRTPVREALQRLAFEKLVVIAPKKGTFVSDLSVVQLQQAFEARLLVERYTARVAASAMSDEQIDELRGLAGDPDEVASHGVSWESLELDRKFHLLLADVCDNEFLTHFLRMLLPVTVRLWYYALVRAEDPSAVIEQVHRRHLLVIDALLSRDPDAAENAMVDHIVTFRDEAFALIMQRRFTR
jgi:DNA-binding GntR family transcriptional regulator